MIIKLDLIITLTYVLIDNFCFSSSRHFIDTINFQTEFEFFPYWNSQILKIEVMYRLFA